MRATTPACPARSSSKFECMARQHPFLIVKALGQLHTFHQKSALGRREAGLGLPLLARDASLRVPTAASTESQPNLPASAQPKPATAPMPSRSLPPLPPACLPACPLQAACCLGTTSASRAAWRPLRSSSRRWVCGRYRQYKFRGRLRLRQYQPAVLSLGQERSGTGGRLGRLAASGALQGVWLVERCMRAGLYALLRGTACALGPLPWILADRHGCAVPPQLPAASLLAQPPSLLPCPAPRSSSLMCTTPSTAPRLRPAQTPTGDPPARRPASCAARSCAAPGCAAGVLASAAQSTVTRVESRAGRCQPAPPVPRPLPACRTAAPTTTRSCRCSHPPSSWPVSCPPSSPATSRATLGARWGAGWVPAGHRRCGTMPGSRGVCRPTGLPSACAVSQPSKHTSPHVPARPTLPIPPARGLRTRPIIAG